MKFDRPPGIENSRYSIFRTPPCFDTGGHRCQSDSTHIDEHVATALTLFDTGTSPTSFVNRHGSCLEVAIAWQAQALLRRYPLQERVSLARSTVV
jgi:hypothetical protein